MTAGLVLLAPRAAAAGPALTCAMTEADSIDVDGMLDDWDGVAKARAGGTDSDASFDVRCLYDGTRLLLAFDVRDEHVVRARGKGGDDRLDLQLAAGGAPLTISLLPGVDGIAPRREVGGKAAPGWLKVEDTLQEHGWSAELEIPLAKLAGWGPNVPSLSLSASDLDADVARLASVEHTVTWAGALALGNAPSSRDAFLQDAGLAPGDVTIDTAAELDASSKGPERFLAGGDVIAVLSDHYAYVHLPVERAADVVKVELVDLRGDGSRVVATTVRQRGGGAVRDVLTLWNVEGGQLHPIGSIELGVERGGSKLRSTWTIEPARKWKQARGAKKVLVVRAQPAVAWDEDSYHEARSADAISIHVPWDDDRAGGLFWLDAGDDLHSADLPR
ncbi:MAG TPA: hypothetical protein VHE35_26430 [Kofleriaceae bacterium]|nr:hypothetical protein [Kofleriaceae bacterium]